MTKEDVQHPPATDLHVFLVEGRREAVSAH